MERSSSAPLKPKSINHQRFTAEQKKIMEQKYMTSTVWTNQEKVEFAVIFGVSKAKIGKWVWDRRLMDKKRAERALGLESLI
jgi:hypothetical protein